jgi:adenylyltransferase/sulfurtransferase
MNIDRYIRQTAFAGIGQEGAERIRKARVAVVGMGALGTVVSSHLARAGVGFLRIVDRDYVDLSNLQRQILYTERDAEDQLPKVIAARNHLSAANSEIEIEPVLTDVGARNIEAIVRDVDLILDGTDNFDVRFLINEMCHKLRVPWIYGGALGAAGATMNILHGEGPCLRCLMPNIPAPGTYPTCGTEGVLSMATAVVASIEASEALKILTGSPAISGNFLYFDLWKGVFVQDDAVRDPDCDVCGKGVYELLERNDDDEHVIPLCTPESYQISPKRRARLDLASFASRLEKIGLVSQNGYVLRFDGKGASFTLFEDGRAVIRNAKDEAGAISVYAEYIGL